MNPNHLLSDLDWFIYSDFLDDQGINHFIKEDVLNTEDLWYWENCQVDVGVGIGAFLCDCVGSVGFGDVSAGVDKVGSWYGSGGVGDGIVTDVGS
jgi:hypothetical protein